MLTILVTVISGVFVFAICELLRDMWLIPLQEYRRIKQKISYQLTYYAMYYHNVIDESNPEARRNVPDYKEASIKLREIASELEGLIEILTKLQIGIPKKEDLFNASKELIGLSNSFFSQGEGTLMQNLENQARADEVKKLLKIYSKNVNT